MFLRFGSVRIRGRWSAPPIGQLVAHSKACAQCNVRVKPPRRHTKARGTLGKPAGLGTTTARGNISAAVFGGLARASIIAPGREGSQAGRRPGYGRKAKPFAGLPQQVGEWSGPVRCDRGLAGPLLRGNRRERANADASAVGPLGRQRKLDAHEVPQRDNAVNLVVFDNRQMAEPDFAHHVQGQRRRGLWTQRHQIAGHDLR